MGGAKAVADLQRQLGKSWCAAHWLPSGGVSSGIRCFSLEDFARAASQRRSGKNVRGVEVRAAAGRRVLWLGQSSSRSRRAAAGTWETDFLAFLEVPPLAPSRKRRS